MANPMNVYFKRGTQSALDTLITSNASSAQGVFKAGAFYLTEDTNRLYFAQANNKLVELNQFIHIVPQGETLPDSTTNPNLKTGDFYYWTDNNILAVYTGIGDTNGWIQINPDTRLLASTNAVTTADGNDAETYGVQITTTVQESGKNASRSATGNFTLKGGANVHLALNAGNEIVISADNDHATVYVMSTTATQNNQNAGYLHLGEQGKNETDDVTFNGGGGTHITSDGVGNINITSHSDIQSITNNFSDQGVFSSKISFEGGESDIDSQGITPIITYGEGANLETKKFIGTVGGDPTAHLNVYSRDEIDALFNTKEAEFDGMKFKGVLETPEAATTAINGTNKPGYTYKAGCDINITGVVNAKTGDLIIAEEDTVNDTLTWKVIPSGDDQFIKFTGNVANKALIFEDHYNSDATLSSISFTEDSNNNNAKINITATGTGTNNAEMNFQITHGAPGTGTARTYEAATNDNGRIQSKKGSLTIPTISAISLDPQGHIASISTVEYTVQDTHPTLKDLAYTSLVDNNTGIYGANFALSGQEAQSVNLNLKLTSDNLKLYKVTPSGSDPDNTLKMNLEWESFA